MDLLTAAKQALEALLSWTPTFKIAIDRRDDAITNLRTAIEQAEKVEPVAWNGGKHGREWTTDKYVASGWLKTDTQQAVPLYILDGIKK